MPSISPPSLSALQRAGSLEWCNVRLDSIINSTSGGADGSADGAGGDAGSSTTPAVTPSQPSGSGSSSTNATAAAGSNVSVTSIVGALDGMNKTFSFSSLFKKRSWGGGFGDQVEGSLVGAGGYLGLLLGGGVGLLLVVGGGVWWQRRRAAAALAL